MIPQRMNNGLFYWEISRTNYAEYTRLTSNRIVEKRDDDDNKYVMIVIDKKDDFPDSKQYDIQRMVELECSIKKCGVISIVFAAMYLESEAYTYLAHHLTDDFVKDHLDKFSPLSKWVVGVKMITGESMDKGGIIYQSCRNLFKYRNELVHNKSQKFINDTDTLLEMIDSRDKQFEKEVANSQRAVQEMAKYIHQLHHNKYIPVLNI